MSKLTNKAISITQLTLDRENPRFSAIRLETESEIIRYLINFEELGTLISSILQQGFIELGDRLIVLPDGKKYVVLEGNRRLAALKAISEYNSYLPQAQRKKAKEFWENNPHDLPISCDVVETRNEATYKITSKHISGIHKWNAYSKRNYYSNMFYSSISNSHLSASESLEMIKKTSPESKSKIKNAIIEKNFLDAIYSVTNSWFGDLKELQQLDTETLAGRVLTQLKKVF